MYGMSVIVVLACNAAFDEFDLFVKKSLRLRAQRKRLHTAVTQQDLNQVTETTVRFSIDAKTTSQSSHFCYLSFIYRRINRASSILVRLGSIALFDTKISIAPPHLCWSRLPLCLPLPLPSHLALKPTSTPRS